MQSAGAKPYVDPTVARAVGVVVGIIVLLIILIFLFVHRSELLSNISYLDQMAMEHSDPTGFKYLGNERDVSGMSYRDYYLENQRNAQNLAGPQYLRGDAAFYDHTDYLDMPKQYRPLDENRPASMGASQLKSYRAPWSQEPELEHKVLEQAMKNGVY